MSIIAVIFAAALADAPTSKLSGAKGAFVEYHGGGRKICRLASRLRDQSEIQLWFSRDGRASIIKGNERLKVAELKDLPITVDALPTKAKTDVNLVKFRAGSVAFNFRVYSRAKEPSIFFVSVVQDPDESSDVPYEIASGFCSSLIPMISGPTTPNRLIKL